MATAFKRAAVRVEKQKIEPQRAEENSIEI